MRYRQEEKRIEKEILMYLYRKGIFAWKQNTVGVYDERNGVYRRPKSPFIIKGHGDIIGLYDSTFLSIEIKTPERRNNLTKHQKDFMENIKKHGGIAFVACSVEDVERELFAGNYGGIC